MFSKLFGRRGHVTTDADPEPVQPDQPVEIVGDVHGRADLVDALPPPRPGVFRVFVGDVVDRGPDSKGVIDRLRALTKAGDGLCLMGNHERMLLDFLDRPQRTGDLWLRNGGADTLASYGIALPSERPSAGESALETLRDRFREALGSETEAWLRDRPLLWRSGSLAIVHAAADPARSLEDQRDQVLLWGHRDFATTSRRDGLWIAHGHTIVRAPLAEAGRISVDTGAYRTGRLTMADVARSGTIRFTTATVPDAD